MNHPYKKHDQMLGRDLTNAERLQPAVSTLNHAKRLIDQFSDDLAHASDKLTEEQLELLCKAAHVIYQASENAAFIGYSNFHPYPLETVAWKD